MYRLPFYQIEKHYTVTRAYYHEKKIINAETVNNVITLTYDSEYFKVVIDNNNNIIHLYLPRGEPGDGGYSEEKQIKSMCPF